MTIPFYLKRNFEEVIFLLKYHQTPQEMEHRKRKKERENVLNKENKKKEEEKKAPRVSSNKGEVNILRREKHFNIKIYFLM
jgi:hypothetical protein